MEFIVQNWQFLVIAVLTVIIVIISLIKKPVKLEDSALTSLLEKLPSFIAIAEKVFSEKGKGVDKKSLVMTYAKSYYSRLGGIIENEDLLDTIISDQIENILCTPEKK